jgi:hypothetical protein
VSHFPRRARRACAATGRGPPGQPRSASRRRARAMRAGSSPCRGQEGCRSAPHAPSRRGKQRVVPACPAARRLRRSRTGRAGPPTAAVERWAARCSSWRAKRSRWERSVCVWRAMRGARAWAARC